MVAAEGIKPSAQRLELDRGWPIGEGRKERASERGEGGREPPRRGLQLRQEEDLS